MKPNCGLTANIESFSGFNALDGRLHQTAAATVEFVDNWNSSNNSNRSCWSEWSVETFYNVFMFGLNFEKKSFQEKGLARLGWEF